MPESTCKTNWEHDYEIPALFHTVYWGNMCYMKIIIIDRLGISGNSQYSKQAFILIVFKVDLEIVLGTSQSIKQKAHGFPQVSEDFRKVRGLLVHIIIMVVIPFLLEIN